jgi:hypothetical protein
MAVAQPGGNSIPKFGLDNGVICSGLLIKILVRGLGLFPAVAVEKYGFAEGGARKYESCLGEVRKLGDVTENSTRKRTGLRLGIVPLSPVISSIRHLSGPAQSLKPIPLLKPPPSTLTPSRSRSLPMTARVLETSSEEYSTPPCPWV